MCSRDATSIAALEYGAGGMLTPDRPYAGQVVFDPCARSSAEAPRLNPNAGMITGVICGYRIEDPLMRKLRYLDKLVDELAKGRAMEKILRK